MNIDKQNYKKRCFTQPPNEQSEGRTAQGLTTEGFRRIKSRYPCNCHFCKQRLPVGSYIFWKKQLSDTGPNCTITVCSKCWLERVNPITYLQRNESNDGKSNDSNSKGTIDQYFKKEGDNNARQ